MIRGARAPFFALLLAIASATSTAMTGAKTGAVTSAKTGAMTSASADTATAKEQASAAYDRGVAAFDKGDFELAAHEFAIADATLPSATALRAAIEAAIKADDPVLGMELLDRVPERPHDDALSAAAKTAAIRFAHRTGRIHVSCGAGVCRASIDGVAFDPAFTRYVAVGPHHVTIDRGGSVDDRVVDVAADALVDIAPPASTSSAPARDHDHGLSPAYFWIGVGLTTTIGALTIASALDASSKHGKFVDAGCARLDVGGCDALANDGASAQRRTNWLVGATAIAAVLTVTTGVFFVQWSRGDVVSVTPTDRGLVASLRLAF